MSVRKRAENVVEHAKDYIGLDLVCHGGYGFGILYSKVSGEERFGKGCHVLLVGPVVVGEEV